MTDPMIGTTEPKQPAAASGASVTPLVFWIVSGVLLAAVVGVYFLLNDDIQKSKEFARAQMNAVEERQGKKTEDAVTAAQTMFKAELAKLKQDTDKELKLAKEKLEKDELLIATLRKEHDVLATSVKTDLTQQIASTRTDLGQTNQVVHSIEVKVKYLQDDVTRIDGRLKGFDDNFLKLTAEGAALKKEQEQLKSEVLSVTSSGKATTEELDRLQRKTQQFELKVMAERARQAALELKRNNREEVLRLLDFVDDKKPVETKVESKPDEKKPVSANQQ